MGKTSRKVLFMTPQPFFQWRGSPIRVGFNVQALAESGCDVDLLAMPVGEDKQTEGVRLLRVPNVLGVRNMPIGPSALKAFYDIFLFFKALGLARRNRYDVIHAVEDAGALGVIISKLAGGKLIFEKHSDPASYKKGLLRNFIMFLYSKVENFSIRHADAVIGTGPALVEHAKKVNPDIPVHHIFDIPSSLVEADRSAVSEVRAKLLGDPEELLVSYVGSFAVYQGIDLMFDSIPKVARRDARARFIIIGGTSEEIEQRRRWLADRGVAEAVTFLGKIPPDELPAYLAASDVLLSPRISGANTPLKLLDYLKARSAIVACDNPANRLILDESTAILVQPDADSFAEGVCRALDDEAMRQSLSAQGRKLVDDTYNFAEFKRRLAVCYEALAGEGGTHDENE